MSELSFEQMLEDSVKTIRNGEIVQGTVIDVKDDEIILNIGYKADGIITKSEYSNDASLVLTDAVHVGDSMEAKVLKVNDGEGQVILTYKRLAAEKGNKRLEAAFESQEVLKAPVTQVLDGGLCVNVEEARVFIPASLVSDTYEKRIFQNMQIKKSNSLSLNSIQEEDVSLVTVNSFFLLKKQRNRKNLWRNPCWRYCNRYR